MADGFAALDAHIARVKGLGDLGRKAAPDVADAVNAELRKQIAAGVDPQGKPWPKREDGGQALETAAQALRVAAVGARVVARLTGHVARHHRGRVRGGVVRQILPTGAIPPAMAAAIKRVLTEHFGEAMSNG